MYKVIFISVLLMMSNFVVNIRYSFVLMLCCVVGIAEEAEKHHYELLSPDVDAEYDNLIEINLSEVLIAIISIKN